MPVVEQPKKDASQAAHRLERRVRTPLVAAIIAYVVTHAIEAIAGVRYRIFDKPFDVWRFAVDLGIWVCVYATVLWLLYFLARRK